MLTGNAWQGKISESLSNHSWWGAQKITVWWWVLSVTEFRDSRGWSQPRLTSLMWSCTEANRLWPTQMPCGQSWLSRAHPRPSRASQRGSQFLLMPKTWVHSGVMDSSVLLCAPEIQEHRCCSRQNQRQGIHWDPPAQPSLIPSPPKALLPLVLPSRTVNSPSAWASSTWFLFLKAKES